MPYDTGTDDVFATRTLADRVTVAALTSTRPNETLTAPEPLSTKASVLVATARSARMRPAPTRIGAMATCWSAVMSAPRAKTSWVAVLMRAALTARGPHPGCADRTSAATPAAWGAAIDVPLPLNPSLPVP